MFRNEFVKYEDRLYVVKKVFKIEHNPNINIEEWKMRTGSDVALRRGELLYFCELVPELEDITNQVEDKK